MISTGTQRDRETQASTDKSAYIAISSTETDPPASSLQHEQPSRHRTPQHIHHPRPPRQSSPLPTQRPPSPRVRPQEVVPQDCSRRSEHERVRQLVAEVGEVEVGEEDDGVGREGEEGDEEIEGFGLVGWRVDGREIGEETGDVQA